jgi:hypothetical protein
MSRKLYVAAVNALVVIAAPLTFAICGCSSTSSGASSVASQASSPATSSAVAKAKDQATACIQKTGTSALLTSSGRSELINCLKSIVPPAKQEAFKSCITSAATSDKLWTSDGRAKFMNTSLPNCVNSVA